LRLSPSGRFGDPGVSRSTPPVFHGDQPRRDTTHRPRTTTEPPSPWGSPPLGDPAFRALLTFRLLEVPRSCPCGRSRRPPFPECVPDARRSHRVRKARLSTTLAGL